MRTRVPRIPYFTLDPITGTGASTLDGFVVGAAGAVGPPVSGAGDPTLEAFVAVAFGSTVVGAGAAELGPLACAADGLLLPVGVGAGTIGDFICVADGARGGSGVGAAVLEDLVCFAEGVRGASGVGSAILDGPDPADRFVVEAVGAWDPPTMSGYGQATLGPFTTNTSGGQVLLGSASASLGALAAIASGWSLTIGTGATSVSAVSAVAVGLTTASAVGSSAIPEFLPAAGVGGHIAPCFGVHASALASFACAAAGFYVAPAFAFGSATIVVPAGGVRAEAVGTVFPLLFGVGSRTLPNFTVSASGQALVNVFGPASASTTPFLGTAVGIAPVIGVGSASLGAMPTAASGLAIGPVQGAAAVVLPLLPAVAAGAFVTPVSGVSRSGLSLGSLDVAADGASWPVGPASAVVAGSFSALAAGIAAAVGSVVAQLAALAAVGVGASVAPVTGAHASLLGNVVVSPPAAGEFFPRSTGVGATTLPAFQRSTGSFASGVTLVDGVGDADIFGTFGTPTSPRNRGTHVAPVTGVAAYMFPTVLSEVYNSVWSVRYTKVGARGILPGDRLVDATSKAEGTVVTVFEGSSGGTQHNRVVLASTKMGSVLVVSGLDEFGFPIYSPSPRRFVFNAAIRLDTPTGVQVGTVLPREGSTAGVNSDQQVDGTALVPDLVRETVFQSAASGIVTVMDMDYAPASPAVLVGSFTTVAAGARGNSCAADAALNPFVAAAIGFQQAGYVDTLLGEFKTTTSAGTGPAPIPEGYGRSVLDPLTVSALGITLMPGLGDALLGAFVAVGLGRAAVFGDGSSLLGSPSVTATGWRETPLDQDCASCDIPGAPKYRDGPFWFHFESSCIVVDAPSGRFGELTVLQVYEACQRAQASEAGIQYGKIASASGLTALTDDVQVALTVELLGLWHLCFSDGLYQMRVTGGNLTGGPGGPFAFTPSVQVVLVQAASAMVIDGGAPTADEVATAVWAKELPLP